jgi:hypothetical protein
MTSRAAATRSTRTGSPTSPQRWAHRRVTLPSRATQRRLEQGGWTAVGTWFPFRYFKRALDDAAPADEAA